MNDKEKAELLKTAYAFLMPIEWDEPFGIVMVEAMACGTPVIALDHGAVSEVIDNGITGYVCSNIDECVKSIVKVGSIKRNLVRQSAMSRFSANVISKKYLQLYKKRISIMNKQ